MKPIFRSALILLTGLSLIPATSCLKKKHKAADTPPPGDTVTAEMQQPTNEFYVWVDKLRARKTPGMDGEILTELQHGEKLIFLNERSEKKDKAILRGKEYEDVWMKVKLPDGRIGWVFAAAITQDMAQVMEAGQYLIKPGVGVGPIDFSTTPQKLAIAFGKENVREARILTVEGQTSKGYQIYHDSADELECTCCSSGGGVSSIIIRKPGGKWATAEGIRVGISLDSLVKLNGKPITFSGFGWDYGGQVIGYNGGNLEKYYGQMSLVLGEPNNIEGLDDFMGDRECSTADKRILGKGVRVAEIWINGEPETD